MHTANGSNTIMLDATGLGGVTVITIALAVGRWLAGRWANIGSFLAGPGSTDATTATIIYRARRA